ncbi:MULTISPECIES: DUF1654 domain-containing protein [Pseudomonas]|jgi:hypothetical protein|uniref:DUF1654 domain-containing protein n=1 Tax=Pseudomonas TaxID=286 RepID=UPI000C8831C2|nr:MULTISPECIES: DUF1654 domain-containing protein [Pseudomonas]MBV7552048.1 DUF1654 domain-containing protein [Pseudomonas sp. PDM28]MDF9773688.1 hypothetical protein [Pseudomonas baetica]PMZ74896.1 hypothetical protein C1X65_14970 [Pseudomonas sp. FW305-70]
MAKPQNKPTLPDSFELLGLRIQKIISAPTAQKRKTAVIRKTSDECPQDWKRLLEDIADTEDVTLSPEEDDAIRVSWRLPANI